MKTKEERRPISFRPEANENGEIVNKERQRGYFHGFFESMNKLDEIGISRPIAVCESLTGCIFIVPAENVMFIDRQNEYVYLMLKSEDKNNDLKIPNPQEYFDEKHRIQDGFGTRCEKRNCTA